MAKAKYHYYVLVITNHGPVFVTSIPERNYARWDATETPLELSKGSAEDIAMGLNLNGYTARVVYTQHFEQMHQLYRYGEGQLEWKWKEKEEGK